MASGTAFNAGECAEPGRILAAKVNLSTGPVTVLLRLKAISVISAEGQPFHDPVVDAILFEAIRSNLHKEIRLVEINCTINDPEFARICAEVLLEHLGIRPPAEPMRRSSAQIEVEIVNPGGWGARKEPRIGERLTNISPRICS